MINLSIKVVIDQVTKRRLTYKTLSFAK